jgi:hypothetical protein
MRDIEDAELEKKEDKDQDSDLLQDHENEGG